MGEALYARINPRHELSEPARRYAYATPVDMAKELLTLCHRRSGEIEGLAFAYLSGNEGPQVESRSGWDVDSVEIRVILDFGAGSTDHRGWFQNPGA